MLNLKCLFQKMAVRIPDMTSEPLKVFYTASFCPVHRATVVFAIYCSDGKVADSLAAGLFLYVTARHRWIDRAAHVNEWSKANVGSL